MHIEQNAKGINEKKIDCHHDSRFLKTNYLKTNLLKQIKKISFILFFTKQLSGDLFHAAKLLTFYAWCKHFQKKVILILIYVNAGVSNFANTRIF
jgi:hypothetical protein